MDGIMWISLDELETAANAPHDVSVDTIVVERVERGKGACGRVTCSDGQTVLWSAEINPNWQFTIDLFGPDVDFILQNQILLVNAVNIELLAKVA